MEARMGKLQGGIAVDNPQVPGPSPLSQGAQVLGQTASTVGGALQRGLQDITAVAPDALRNPVVQDVARNVVGPLLGGRGNADQPPSAITSAFDALNPMETPDTTPLGSLASALAQQNIPGVSGAADVAQMVLNSPGVLDSLMLPDALARKYGTTDSSQYSATDQQRLSDAQTNARLAVGGMEMPEVPRQLAGARPQSVADLADALKQYPEDVQDGLRQFVQSQSQAGVSGKDINDTLRQWVADNPLRPAEAEATPSITAPENPYRLQTTPPTPDAQPVSPDERLDHFEILQQRYATVEQQLSDLDDQLNNARGMRPERPPWAVGWTNNGLIELARSQGVSAYEPLWWEKAGMLTGSGEVREDALQSGLKLLGGRQPTAADLRDQIQQLTAERSQLMDAANDLAGHADDTPLYRPQGAPTEELPFDVGYTPARGGVPEAEVGPAAAPAAGEGAPVAPPAAVEARPGAEPAPPGPVPTEGVAPGFTAPETQAPSLEEFLANAPRADDVVPTRTVAELTRGLRTPQGPPGISIERGYTGIPGGPEVADTGTRYAVYRDGQGEPVGVLEMLVDRQTGQPDLLQVAVDPAYQRQGIATSLYRAAQDAGYDVESASGAGGYTEAGARLAYARRYGGGPGPVPTEGVSAAPVVPEPKGPPLEALTSGTTPPPPEAPPSATPAGPPPQPPGLVSRILAAPGGVASRFGSLIASALGPVENLPTDTQGVLRNYANMVGRQSDAARVLAENQLRAAGADLTIPAVADEVRQMRGQLADDAARKLVTELQAQGKAAPIRNAPREFRTVTDDPNTYLANYAFSPDVVAPIKAVTDTGQISSNPLGSAVLRAIGTAKGTLFSLSNFHTVTEGLNSAFTSPQTLANYARAFGSDSFAQGLRGSMADTIDAAAQAGVTGLAEKVRPEDVGAQIGDALWRRVVSGGVSGAGGAAAGYTETKLTGGSEEEARANAAKGGLAGLALGGLPLGARGTVPEILQSALWDRAVPLAKATAWDGLVKGGMDASQAANVVNERFGGLNYAAMGRNPTLVDAQRLLLQASDWNEATVRQLGSAMFGGTGQGVRAGFLAKTLGGMLTATEVANYALSGHSTLENQPGHQFEVEVRDPNGGYLHFGILPGNVQAYLNLANTEVSEPAKRGTQPTNFIVNRLSAPVGAGIDMALTAAGKPPYWVAKAGPIAYAENVAPIGVSQVLQSTLHGGMNPLVAAGLAAAGLNPRYSAAARGGGGFTSPDTTRAPLPTRSSEAGGPGARAPLPKR
jgi:hypothetical protein